MGYLLAAFLFLVGVCFTVLWFREALILVLCDTGGCGWSNFVVFMAIALTFFAGAVVSAGLEWRRARKARARRPKN